MQTTKRLTRIDQICKKVIADRWGDIDAFPEELVQTVFHITREFIVGYLNFFGQKKGKPPDWFPETLVIDKGLVDDMRQFFFRLSAYHKGVSVLERENKRIAND